VVDAVGRRSKVAWVMVSQNVSVVGVEGRVLQLGFTNPGLRDNFPGSRSEEVLRDALREITGTDWRLSAIVDPSAGSFGQSGPPAPPPASSPSGGSFPAAPGPGQSGQFGAPPSGTGGFSTPPAMPQERTQPANPATSEPSVPPFGATAAAAPGSPPDWAVPPESGTDPGAAPAWAEADMPDPDDEDVPDARITARDLLISELGATVLEDGARPD
jgi:DNA polymerase-3 subunit gamma/tau